MCDYHAGNKPISLCTINYPEITMSNPYIYEDSLNQFLEAIQNALEDPPD